MPDPCHFGYAFFFLLRCITQLFKALYIAGDNSGASSSATIGYSTVLQ